jgi:hypothetical protein
MKLKTLIYFRQSGITYAHDVMRQISRRHLSQLQDLSSFPSEAVMMAPIYLDTFEFRVTAAERRLS